MKRSCRYSPVASSVRCACLLAAALPLGVAWADWEAVSDVEMGVESNDNPRLGQRGDLLDPNVPDDHTSVRMYTDALVDLRNSGPRGNVYLRPRVRLDTYADEVDDDLQRDDIYLNSRASYDWTRTSAGLRANFARESILSAETPEAGIVDPDDVITDPPIDTETGNLLLLNEHRSTALLAPFASFEISERSDVTLEATYLDVAYSGPQLPGRSDFTNTRLALGIGRSIDDRTRAEARLLAGTFEADFVGNQTDIVGVEGTFRRTLSESWSFFLSTGLQRSEFSFVDAIGNARIENASSDFTYALGFRKRAIQSTLNVDIQRLLAPNGVGFLVERNEFRVNYERRMTERLTGGVAVRYIEVGALEGGGATRDFSRIDLNLEWAFTQTWSLNTALGAMDQQFGGPRADGDANIFTVGVVYRGLSRTAAPAR